MVIWNEPAKALRCLVGFEPRQILAMELDRSKPTAQTVR